MTAPSVCFVCGNIYPLLANQVSLPHIGGSEVQQYLLGQGLVERGFRVTFITEEYGQGPDLNLAGFRVLSFRLIPNKLIEALTLVRALRRAAADVYYVRDMPKYGALIYLFCRASGRKIVQALAGDPEIEPENMFGLLARWFYCIHAAWRRRADLVIAQTQFQAERLLAGWHIVAEVVPNIVPVEPGPLATARPATPFRVLWVGMISPRKRVEWAADIARRMPQMEFVVVGGLAREAPGYYAAAQPQLVACPNVRWLGFVPYAQVTELFRSAHVLLHTGDGKHEGFPNVFLQAWAAGIPVVSTGVNPDGLLTQGGLGVCTVTIEEAAAALQELADEPARREAIGQRARAYAWEYHRPEAVLPRFEALFGRLLDSV
jgi:glycosyltransferase involved in cell wall biosynthesis